MTSQLCFYLPPRAAQQRKILLVDQYNFDCCKLLVVILSIEADGSLFLLCTLQGDQASMCSEDGKVTVLIPLTGSVFHDSHAGRCLYRGSRPGRSYNYVCYVDLVTLSGLLHPSAEIF